MSTYLNNQKEQAMNKRKNNASEKKLKHFIRRKLNRGSSPLKELEEFLRQWMEQCDRMDQPVLIIKSLREDAYHQLDTIFPEIAWHDKNYYKIDAVKWKTRKAKDVGEYRQSPIDIKTDKVKKCKYYRNLHIIGLWDKRKQTTIRNSGHGVTATIEGDAFVSEGPLFGKYKLDSYHIHFGDKNNDGTEHAINGERFALEMHIVFIPIFCDDYPHKVLEARSMAAVLTLMFKESKEPTCYEFFTLIPHLKQKGKKLVITNNFLYDFKDVLSSSEYYNYAGSRTTEPYDGPFEFIIFKQSLPIHKSQLDPLRQLKKEGYITPSIRPLQYIGDRTVFEPSYKDHIKCRGKPVCDC